MIMTHMQDLFDVPNTGHCTPGYGDAWQTHSPARLAQHLAHHVCPRVVALACRVQKSVEIEGL